MLRPPSEPPFDRVAIVGLGLVGGSTALACRRAWPQVKIVGVDRPDILQAALARHAIHDARQDIADLRDVGLIVFATPVSIIVDQIARAGSLGLPAIVTDVGSTKRRIMAAASAAGLATFVGGHPMAGAEQSGFEHARQDLFEGRPWLLVRGTGDASAFDRVAHFVSGLGAAPAEVDPVTHDRTMAYVSHLPQLLSSALMRSAGERVGDSGLAVGGRAFAEMTRLASSPVEVWQGILATNADFIAEALHAVRGSLPETSAELGDEARIDRLFLEARAWRDRLVAAYTLGP